LIPTLNQKATSAYARRQGRQPRDIDDQHLGTVWRLSGQSIDARIPSFSEELAIRLVLLGSEIGDHVLYVFGGAGTLGVAPKKLNRHFTLLEIDPEFAEIARDRIARTVV
jgi:DNA modification methylase